MSAKNFFRNDSCKPLTIEELLEINFTELPLSEKIRIRDFCQPRPNFVLRADASSKKREFNTVQQATKIYREHDWVCGDDRKKAFYCFPCLLYNREVYRTSKNPATSFVRHHTKNETHVKNAYNLAMLGKNSILTSNLTQNGIYKTHNESVKKNRHLLLKIIKGFMEHGDLYEYVLNGENSIYSKLESMTFMDLLYKVDSSLKECYEYSPLFSTIRPSDLEMQLLTATFHLYQKFVLGEIRAAKYVALITEETTDIAHRDQLMIVLRYLLDSKVVERFWTFVSPAQRDAKSYAKYILDELDTVLPTQKDKLISQSHIGGVVFSPLISDVHRLIADVYKNAIYVHYHAYKLTLVMERAVCQNSRVRDFFANLYGIYTFFERQPKILQAFFDATPLYSEGSFEKGALVFIYENKGEILNFMIMLHTDLDSSPSFIHEADVCEKLLVDDGFVYFLSFFYYLMADVNVFYESLQNSYVDSVKIAAAINEFLDEIRKTKDAIAVENSDNDDKSSEAFLRAFAKIEVCNVILKEIKERFSFTHHWEAHILFKSDQYYKFHGNFPEIIMHNVTEYFKFNCPDRLRRELQTLYTRSELMVCRNAHDLLWVFHHYNLKSVFEKTTALMHVVLTMPTMLSEAESKISAVKRVRRVAAVVQNEQSESGLTVLLSEGKALKSFRCFAERLVEVYIQQEHREKDFVSC